MLDQSATLQWWLAWYIKGEQWILATMTSGRLLTIFPLWSSGVFPGEFNMRFMVFWKVLFNEVCQDTVKNSEACHQCWLTVLSSFLSVLFSPCSARYSSLWKSCLCLTSTWYVFKKISKYASFFTVLLAKRKRYLGHLKSSAFYLTVLEGQPFWLHRSCFGQF